MSLIIKCRSCRALIKDHALPCPACGSLEQKFFIRYRPDGRNGRRVWQPLEDSVVDIKKARHIESIYRAAALEGRKPGTVPETLTTATLEDLTPDYLKWVKLHYTKQTHREREYTMEYIKKIIGNVPVLAINDHHFSLYQETRSEQFQKTDKDLKISGRTINKELNYVRGFLRWCRDEKKLATREIKIS